MSNSNFDEAFGGVFDSFAALTKGDAVELVPRNAAGVDIASLVNDHIYGLLTKKELTPQEITLLSALLSYKKGK